MVRVRSVTAIPSARRQQRVTYEQGIAIVRGSFVDESVIDAGRDTLGSVYLDAYRVNVVSLARWTQTVMQRPDSVNAEGWRLGVSVTCVHLGISSARPDVDRVGGAPTK